MTVLQAPIDLSTATRVGPRTYRKQVLAKRSIDYPMPDGSTRPLSLRGRFLLERADGDWVVYGYDVALDDGSAVASEVTS